MKKNADIFTEYLCSRTNGLMKSSTFPSCLKVAYITGIHKKDKKDINENYRPVSILPVLSKVFLPLWKGTYNLFRLLFSKHNGTF